MRHPGLQGNATRVTLDHTIAAAVQPSPDTTVRDRMYLQGTHMRGLTLWRRQSEVISLSFTINGPIVTMARLLAFLASTSAALLLGSLPQCALAVHEGGTTVVLSTFENGQGIGKPAISSGRCLQRVVDVQQRQRCYNRINVRTAAALINNGLLNRRFVMPPLSC